MKQRAGILRKQQTDAERLLWSRLRNRQPEGYKFRRQQAIDRYIVDFVCLELKLVIELDGEHIEKTQQDEQRAQYLQDLGYRILRFGNHAMLREPDAVLEAIRAAIAIRTPHPNPLPGGEGAIGLRNSGAGRCAASPFPGRGEVIGCRNLHGNLWDTLAQLPRLALAEFPTPLLPLRRLSRTLGSAEIWCKRDDLISFGLGGNKVRGLELLIADALGQDADVIVTGAGVQSNHVRATAAAAAYCGLRSAAVFWGDAPERNDGNYRVTRMLGAEAVFTGDPDRASVDQGIANLCDAMRCQGRRPYAIPRGGACALGALGHVLAARELYEQCTRLNFAPETVVLAVGSGGTHAGWLLGTRALDAPWRVESFTVSREADAVRAEIARLATEAAAMLGLDWRFSLEEVVVHGGFIGEGYGIPSPEAAEAIRLVGRSEGVLLDPTYTGKAMAGLIERLRHDPAQYRSVVFLHTGGEPAFFAGTGDWLSLGSYI